MPAGCDTEAMTILDDRGLQIGDLVGDLDLTDQRGQPWSLAQRRRDKAVALVFFPYAFSGLCRGELSEIRDDLGQFDTPTVELVALSCDSVYALRAWASAEAFFFPLLSDFWPHGAVASRFGVLDPAGHAARASFLIGRDGRVRYRDVHPASSARDFAGLKAAITSVGAACG